MSPSNINSFVGDLVQMAQAMEQLPKVEQELRVAEERNQQMFENTVLLKADLEQSRNYAASLEQKVRSLEVERDDASFRVLEAEDRDDVVLNVAKEMARNLEVIILQLDPLKPQPEPVKEPEAEKSYPDPQDRWEGWPDRPLAEVAHSIVETGQSENSPTSSVTSGEQKLEQTSVTSSANSDATSVDPGPALGPYFGKRYYDQSSYMPLNVWLDGGGSIADYNWRPSGVNDGYSL